MAGIIHIGSDKHNLHLKEQRESNQIGKKLSIPNRNPSSRKEAFELLMAMSKEDLVATAELEEVEFKHTDTKEVIANAILDSRK